MFSLGKRARKLRATQQHVNPSTGDETTSLVGRDEPTAEMLAGQLGFARLILRHVEPENDTNRNYTAAGRRFSGMVSAGHSRGGIGRAVRRAWLHGDSPVGVRDLGKHAASTRRDVSRHRSQQRLFPAFHSAEL